MRSHYFIIPREYLIIFPHFKRKPKIQIPLVHCCIYCIIQKRFSKRFKKKKNKDIPKEKITITMKSRFGNFGSQDQSYSLLSIYGWQKNQSPLLQSVLPFGQIIWLYTKITNFHTPFFFFSTFHAFYSKVGSISVLLLIFSFCLGGLL